MLALRPVVLVTGVLVAFLGAAMLIPMMVDLLSADEVHRANWTAFAIGAIICVFTGGGAAAASWGEIHQVSVREGFLLTATSWLSLVIFAAIPLAIGELQLSYIDAFFEAMSGLTTTGATVVNGLDDAPRGALLWRSMLQWFGGVGIIIMAFAVLPALKGRRHADFQKRGMGYFGKVYCQRRAVFLCTQRHLCVFHSIVLFASLGVRHAFLGCA